jgi:hypothetical protein
MPIPRLSLPFCACLAAAALVSACGGDEEAAAPPGEADQVLALSAANEPGLSAAAVQEFSAAQAIAGRGAGSSPGQISIARRPVQQALLSVARAGRVHALAAEPFTEDCSGGGTLTIEVADDLLSSKTTFNACVESGDTLNGTVSLVAVSASDDGQQLLFDVTLDGLALTQGTVTDKLTGDLRMSVDTSTAGQSSTTFSSVPGTACGRVSRAQWPKAPKVCLKWSGPPATRCTRASPPTGIRLCGTSRSSTFPMGRSRTLA